MRVGAHMTDMQRARNGRRRRVDYESLVPAATRVVAVDLGVFPEPPPALFHRAEISDLFPGHLRSLRLAGARGRTGSQGGPTLGPEGPTTGCRRPPAAPRYRPPAARRRSH